MANKSQKRGVAMAALKLMIVTASVSCTMLKPGCHHQQHAVRIAQLDQQYEHCAGFSSSQMLYRNWQKRPMKMTRIPFTQLYIP